MSSDLKRSVGFQIAKARLAKGLTQEQVAELTDRSVEAISNVERGKSFPSFATLVNLSEHLGVSVRDLFEDAPVPTSERGRLSLRLSVVAAALPDDALRLAVEQMEVLERWTRRN